MVRGKNPDGTPKRYAYDRRRKRESTETAVRTSGVGRMGRATVTAPDHWSKDPVILQRLEVVERARLAGHSALTISRELRLPVQTVLEDFTKLNDLWLQRTARGQEALRAEAVRRLDTMIRNGMEMLRMDEVYTQAVLFNMPVAVTCPGRQQHQARDLAATDTLGDTNAGATWGEAFSCTAPHTMYKRVYHDEKGSAQYRRVAGQVMQAINSAITAQARIQGLIVEKKSLTDAEGRDLPEALKAILLGDDLPNALPTTTIRDDGMPVTIDVGLA